MARDIRYRDGTVRHVYGGPGLRRRRPPGMVILLIVGVIVLWIARAGGKS